MIMLGRRMETNKHGEPCQTFDIAGTEGSLYSTTIGTMYKCDCQDFVSVGQSFDKVFYSNNYRDSVQVVASILSMP
jgi:hypothetical protein